VANDPFPHVVGANFVPPAALRSCSTICRRWVSAGSFPVGGMALGPVAQSLMAELEGDALRAAIAEKFGLDLAGSPTMLTLRAWTTERDGQIHCDFHRQGAFTVLLVLNPAGDTWGQHEGCLRLLRGPRDLEDYAVEVPPVNGTLLVFPNTAQSWHGHKVVYRPALQPAAQLYDHRRQGPQRIAPPPPVGVHEAPDPRRHNKKVSRFTETNLSRYAG